jgi:signal peptidase I
MESSQTPNDTAQPQADSGKPEKSECNRTFAGRLWHGWVKPMAVAVVLVCTFRSAVADWNDVPSQSMEPTILVGDRIFVNKLAYDLKVPFTSWHLAEWGGPARGDVVVFFSPVDGRRMVKRVVGVPGDVIELRSNHLYLNGKPLSYGVLDLSGIDPTDLSDPTPHEFASERLGESTHAVMTQPRVRSLRTFGPVTVPRDQYFVMGDNRDNSGDSRIFGFVPRNKIVGEAVGLAFSLDRSAGFSPRWDRFLRGF